ncbi:hypothetical protein EZS27_000825 [termite gut metagenome]|uniref:Uncharacterized protein n=1 Tax=termite gut metagenome TaxID=433724 RepID=A0A5J4T046_9ZZZZ
MFFKVVIRRFQLNSFVAKLRNITRSAFRYIQKLSKAYLNPTVT